MDKRLIQTDRFICGDAEEILKSLPSNSIDLIVADPLTTWARTTGILSTKRIGLNIKFLQKTGCRNLSAH